MPTSLSRRANMEDRCAGKARCAPSKSKKRPTRSSPSSAPQSEPHAEPRDSVVSFAMSRTDVRVPSQVPTRSAHLLLALRTHQNHMKKRRSYTDSVPEEAAELDEEEAEQLQEELENDYELG